MEVQVIHNQQAMTSLEISELTGKDHKHILTDIRAMLESLGINSADFSAQYKDSTGRALPCFRLPKRETLILVSGYSVAMRAKIIDRWQELESKQQAQSAHAIPQTMAQALRLAADQAEQIEAQQATIALQAPKVEALDRIATANGSMCITNAAKALQCQPKRLFAHLQSCQWIYRRAGGSGFVGYQDKIQQGLLDHKVTTIERSDGTSKMVEQVLVTPKGLTKLATLLTLN